MSADVEDLPPGKSKEGREVGGGKLGEGGKRNRPPSARYKSSEIKSRVFGSRRNTCRPTGGGGEGGEGAGETVRERESLILE